jgi:predicted nucleic-acid-binding Zn-ribbon protein
MKKSGVCPKCNGQRVGRMAYVADESDATTEPGRKRSLWWQLEKTGGFFSMPDQHRADVEAYVCTQCGYFEEYVKDAHLVEWEKLEPFNWHRPR